MQSESVNQWLDADQVRALAESLLAPGPSLNPSPNESIYGESFEGFTVVAAEQSSSKALQSFSKANPGAVSARGISEKPELAERASVENPAAVRKTVPSLPKEPEIKLEPIEQPRPRPQGAPTPVAPQSLNSPRLGEKEKQRHIVASAQAPAREPQPASSQPIKMKQTPQGEVHPNRSQRPEPQRAAVVRSPFKRIAQKQPDRKEPVQRETFRPLPLSTRLQAFGVWLKEQISTQSYFICDRHGEIVVDEVGSEKLIKVARTLAHASSSAGRQVGDDQDLGSLHVKIGPDRVMEVVPRHSHFGLVVLGLIVPRPLSREAAGSVSRALATALADQSSPGQ